MTERPVEAAGSELYPWQAASWQRLMNYVETQRIPHALLIDGAEGIGKLNLALCFANFLLCKSAETSGRRCGRCENCRLFDAGTHPDLIRIEPLETGKAITIDRIRDLSETLSLSMPSGRHRVVILRPADRMNPAAANAFLKTLEEAGRGTVIILLSTRSWDLPPTIRSRCQRLDVPLPDHRRAVDWLSERLPSDDCEFLLAASSGAPLKALECAKNKNLDRRNSVFSSWCEIAANRADPIRIAETLSSFPIKEVLGWISTWTIDMIRLRTVASVTFLSNPDLRTALQAEVGKLELKELFRFYEHLLQSAAIIDSPVNIQLLLESILIDWYSMKRST